MDKQGGADRILSYGIKETEQLESYVQFDRNGYKFVLEPSVNAGFVFTSEHITFAGDLSYTLYMLGHSVAAA